MMGIKPVSGKGFLEEFEAIEKANGSYVDIGWFEEQGQHPTARMSFPELAKLQATGGGGRFIPRDVLKVYEDLDSPLKNKKVIDELNKWLHNPSIDPEQRLLAMIGQEAVNDIKSIFGSDLLHPTPHNPDPLIDTGELRDSTTFKTGG